MPQTTQDFHKILRTFQRFNINIWLQMQNFNTTKDYHTLQCMETLNIWHVNLKMIN